MQTILLALCQIIYVADMKKTTQNLEVFSSLVLQIPFKVRSINFLELFSKVVFNKAQGCYREPLIVLTLFLFLRPISGELQTTHLP